MTVLSDHKLAIRLAAELAVYGVFSKGFVGFTPVTLSERTVSDFDTDLLEYRGTGDNQVNPSSPTPPNEGVGLTYLLQPGWKLVQVRTWMVAEELNAGELRAYIATTQVVVHRSLMDVYDANQYENFEMLVNQEQLLDRSRWTDLDEVMNLTENPDIPTGATRSGNVVSYTMSFQARVDPAA